MSVSKFFIFVLPIWVAMLALDISAAELAGDKDRYAIEFERYVDENVANRTPGAAFIIIEDGQVRSVRSYGVRQVGSGSLVTPETIFRLASVSKTVASSAIGVLVQDKVLDWDIQINSQIHNVDFKNKAYGQRITLQNLLSHTTGLLPHAYTDLIEDNVSYNQVLKRFKNVDFVCAPGKCYSYQNVIFSLAGNIVEKVTGTPYEDFVIKNLFQPLGMKNASFGLNAFVSAANHAVPHVRRKGVWVPTKVTQNYYNVAPAAGVNASILDMGQWLLAHLGQRPDVLSETTLNSIQSRVIKTSRSQAHYKKREEIGDTYYGLGWRIFDFGEEKNIAHHAGWVKGFIAEVVVNRNKQIAMAFLTNAEMRKSNETVFKFLEIYKDYNKELEPESLEKYSSLTPTTVMVRSSLP